MVNNLLMWFQGPEELLRQCFHLLSPAVVSFDTRIYPGVEDVYEEGDCEQDDAVKHRRTHDDGVVSVGDTSDEPLS